MCFSLSDDLQQSRQLYAGLSSWPFCQGAFLENFLKMLGCMLNDIEHNFIDTISAERILQWRAVVQELISVGFAMEFILEHLREIAQAFFMRRVRPAIEAIDVRIELLKKEVVDLEGLREHLLSCISGPSRFGDQSLISGLH